MNETIITPSKNWKNVWQELWDYKEILLFLGWRDILVHYKQTVIGIFWVVIRPLLTVAIFTIIFSKIAGIRTDGSPYALVVFVGMLAWQFFADTLASGSHSFIANEPLVSKVYIPRLMLPASRLLCSFVDFAISFICYQFVAIGYYHVLPSAKILLLPFFVLWLGLFSFIISLLFASLIVRYRDFRHTIPFLLQLGVYATPVGFSLLVVPFQLRLLLAINPMAGIINGFRYSLLSENLCYSAVLISLLATAGMSFLSIVYFKKAEQQFADVI